ncbi:hypothetical protein VTO42DRAFT_451 [Malbranchea cinnamomea]
MATPATVASTTGFLLGVASHLHVFIRGEWERYAPDLAAFYAGSVVVSPLVPLLYLHYVRDDDAPANTATATTTTTTSSHLFAALLITASFWLSYAVGLFGSIVRYRVLSHPLKKFPGPLAAKVTGFWSVKASLPDFKFPRAIQKLHQKHGDFVRIRPREISINHVDAVRDIHGPGTRCVKGPFYDLNYPSRSLQMTRDKAFHAKRRRLWDRGFSMKALKEYEPRVVSHCAELLSQFSALAAKGEPVEIPRWVDYFSFDVMGDLVFGKSFNLVRDGGGHFIFRHMESLKPLVGSMTCVPWLFILLQNMPIARNKRAEWKQWCALQVEERKKMGTARTDLFSHILDETSDDLAPSLGTIGDLVHDSELAIVAGSDTTASTLAALVYLLASHRDKQKLLQAELDQLLTGVDDISHQKLATSAPYLEGCINEALRLYPGAPSGMQRMTPPEGATIAGRYIPGDTLVSTPTYTLHRDPRNFTHPDSFIPERWSSQPHLTPHREAFNPFLIGAYSCAGKALALLELRLTAALLFRTFEFEFSEKHHPDGAAGLFDAKQPGWRDYFTAKTPPFWATMKFRV